MEELLQGRSDTETMSKKYPEFQKEAKAFLDAIQKPIDHNNTEVGEYIWQYSTEEYIETFKKTSESTIFPTQRTTRRARRSYLDLPAPTGRPRAPATRPPTAPPSPSRLPRTPPPPLR